MTKREFRRFLSIYLPCVIFVWFANQILIPALSISEFFVNSQRPELAILFLSNLFGLVDNMAVGFYLLKLEGVRSDSKKIWFLFGLVSSLSAVVFYVLVNIYNSLEANAGVKNKV